MDKNEAIEKKLAQAKLDLEKEKVEMRKIQGQLQALQKKFGDHAVKGRDFESKIDAYNDLLKE